MSQLDGFVAYPENPKDIGETIQRANLILQSYQCYGMIPWVESNVCGEFVAKKILLNIAMKEYFLADITFPNFNVAYEIGYAIGQRKRLVLLKNSSLESEDEIIREVGVFDSLGWRNYQSSEDLASFLATTDHQAALRFDDSEINQSAPVYMITARQKTDLEITITSRVKKARLRFRLFDPDEQGRLSASEAIDNVAQSLGIIVHFLAANRKEARIHNLRSAFISGLAHGMGKHSLLLQIGHDPVPLDYRDFVTYITRLEQVSDHIGDFAGRIVASLQSNKTRTVLETRTFLSGLKLGASAAENELSDLPAYFLETDEYRRALRGEGRIVVGRKGSGKTALFVQLRDRLRQDKKKIVLDLKPEGYQLLKLKDILVEHLEIGTKEHTLTALWEYLLLLEICHKLLEKDREPHLHDHRIFESYRSLANVYQQDEYVSEGDFSERMLKLLSTLTNTFQEKFKLPAEKLRLSSAEITEMIYKHDMKYLRERVEEYLSHKEGLWIYFDNLDKGWPSQGLAMEDVLILQCLLDALQKLERALQKSGIETHGLLFLRNDVYELLVQNTTDRGKISCLGIDWTDPDLLREMLRRRFLFNEMDSSLSFEDIWQKICISHYSGEESSQYLIDRSLMRPRCLLDFFQSCRSHAVNLGHERIEAEDIRQGEKCYSNNLLTDISYEIQDICPEAKDVLYAFIDVNFRLSGLALQALLRAGGLPEEMHGKAIDLLIWYGFLGVLHKDGEIEYIHSVGYNMRMVKALIRKNSFEDTTFCINPAFWSALGINN